MKKYQLARKKIYAIAKKSTPRVYPKVSKSRKVCNNKDRYFGSKSIVKAINYMGNDRRSNILGNKINDELNTVKGSDKRTIVWTDGSCFKNGKKNRGFIGCGIGIFYADKDPRNLSEVFPMENPTNQRAELYAILKAVKNNVYENNLLEIRSDSMYSINSITNWSKKWIKNGWKASNGKDVKNQDIIKPILSLIKKRPGKIEFVHVRGHSGDYGNDQADELAVLASKSSILNKNN